MFFKLEKLKKLLTVNFLLDINLEEYSLMKMIVLFSNTVITSEIFKLFFWLTLLIEEVNRLSFEFNWNLIIVVRENISVEQTICSLLTLTNFTKSIL